MHEETPLKNGWPSQCKTHDCTLEGVILSEEVTSALGLECRTCGATLSSIEGDLTPLQRLVIDRHPQPVASAYRRLLVRTEVDSKVKALVDTFGESLRILALVVKSEYLRSELVDEDVNQILLRDLARPLISSWMKLIDKAVPALAKSGHEFLFTELPEFQATIAGNSRAGKQVVLPAVAYDAFGERTQQKRKMRTIEALLHFRNRIAHDHSHDDAVLERKFDQHHDLLLEFLAGMTWWREHTLCKRDGGVLHELAGCDATKRADVSTSTTAATDLFLRASDGREMKMYPFLVVPGGLFADIEAGEDLLIYEQNTGRRIFYASAAGNSRSTKATIDGWRRLMRRKQAGLTLLHEADIRPSVFKERCVAVTRRTREALHDTQKILPEIYSKRPFLDAHIIEWIDSKYPLLAIAGSAGTGKTALLNHATAQWEVQGHSVLFLRAQFIEARSVINALRMELGINDDVDLKVLAEKGTTANCQLIVVLDGVNENAMHAELLDSAVELASALQGVGHVKVAVSFRSDIADWFFAHQDHSVLIEASERGQTKGFHNPFYMRRNPDVRNVYGGGGLRHYTEHGLEEGRMPNPFSFDAPYYEQRYGMDPAIEDGWDGKQLFGHFRDIGQARGYRPNHFGLMKHVNDNSSKYQEPPSCQQCGSPLEKQDDGTYDIWIATAEKPTPVAHCWDGKALLWYKFCSLNCGQDKARKLPSLRVDGNAEFGLFYPPLEFGSDARTISATPCTLVPAMGTEEIKGMWEIYAKQRGARFRPRFGHEDLGRASNWLQADLANPLMLRVFLQIYAGRNLPSKLSRSLLFDEWFNRLADLCEDGGQFLLDLARVILERRNSLIDFDSLHQDPRTCEVVREMWVGSTYMQLTRRTGVLSEYHRADRIEVTFTVESFLEYVIGRILIHDQGADTPAGLAKIVASSNGDFSLMTGAAMMALERQVRNCGDSFLLEFIDLGNEDAARLGGALVGQQVAHGKEVRVLIKDLLDEATSNDLIAIHEACAWLEKEGLHDLEMPFLQMSLSQIPTALLESPQLWALHGRMADHYAREGRAGAAVQAQQTALKGLESSFGRDNDATARAYARLSELLRGIFRQEEALDAASKAVAAFDAIHASTSPEKAHALARSGRIQLDLGKAGAAKAAFKQAIKIREQIYNSGHELIIEIEAELGEAMAMNEETEKGLAACRNALLLGQQHLPDSHRLIGFLHTKVATCYEFLRDTQSELKYLKRAHVALCRSTVSPESKARADLRIASTLHHQGSTKPLTALIDKLRDSSDAPCAMVLASALLMASTAEQSEGIEILRALATQGNREAMMELSQGLPKMCPSDDTDKEAREWRRRARSFKDTSS